jgi:hypothetical protein
VVGAPSASNNSAMPTEGNPPGAIRRAIEFADREINLAQGE